jgi:hypothetical protein
LADRDLKADRADLDSDTVHIFEQFWYGLPSASRTLDSYLAKLTLGDYLEQKERRIKLVNELRELLKANRDTLIKLTNSRIQQYLSDFEVKSTSQDQLKFAYHLGQAFAERAQILSDTHKKLVLIMTIELMDIMCRSECGFAMPPEMKGKFDWSISNGKAVSEFGEYGIYHSFKTLIKACKKP